MVCLCKLCGICFQTKHHLTNHQLAQHTIRRETHPTRLTIHNGYVHVKEMWIDSQKNQTDKVQS